MEDDPNNSNPVPKIIDTWYLNPKIKVLAIKSGYGTGKTQTIKYIMTTHKPKSVLWIVHRISLTKNLMGIFESFGFKSYQEKQFNAKYIICQIESLHKLYEIVTGENGEHMFVGDILHTIKIPYFDLIIMDEIESLIYHLESPTIASINDACDTICNLNRKANKIIGLDGDFSNRSFEFLNYIENMNKSLSKKHKQNFTIINNTCQAITKNFIFHPKRKDIEVLIEQDIIDKKKIFIVCMSSSEVLALRELFESNEFLERLERTRLKQMTKSKGDMGKTVAEMKDMTDIADTNKDMKGNGNMNKMEIPKGEETNSLLKSFNEYEQFWSERTISYKKPSVEQSGINDEPANYPTKKPSIVGKKEKYVVVVEDECEPLEESTTIVPIKEPVATVPIKESVLTASTKDPAPATSTKDPASATSTKDPALATSTKDSAPTNGTTKKSKKPKKSEQPEEPIDLHTPQSLLRLRVIAHHSKSDDSLKEHLKRVNEFWSDYDIIIISPAIESGVDFDIPHVDKCYAFLCGQSTTPRGFLQMCGRVRQIKDSNMDVYLNKLPYKEVADFVSANDILQLFTHTLGIEKMSNYCEKRYDAQGNISVVYTILTLISQWNFFEEYNQAPPFFVAYLIYLIRKKKWTYKFEPSKSELEARKKREEKLRKREERKKKKEEEKLRKEKEQENGEDKEGENEEKEKKEKKEKKKKEKQNKQVDPNAPVKFKNFTKQKIYDATDITDEQYAELDILRKRCAANEVQKYQLEKHEYKKKWKVDKLTKEIVDACYNKMHVIGNRKSLVAECNGTKIDNSELGPDELNDVLREKKIKEVCTLLNTLGFANPDDNKKFSGDEFEKNLEKSKKCAIFDNKLTKLMFNKFISNGDSIFNKVRIILENYGVALIRDRQQVRANKTRKYIHTYYIEPTKAIILFNTN